jgi:nucleotide-binding universal stress UspA family protein
MSAKIIALIDGSGYAQSVCDLAAWAGLRTGGSVELLHVLGRRDLSSAPVDLSGSLSIDAQDTLLTELASLDEQKAKLAHRRGRMILQAAAARLEAAGLGNHTSRLRTGDLVETVLAAEADAALVVLGKRGEAADFARLHLGSNLERVARAASRPVLVAARAFTPIKRVTLAFDGGTGIRKAIAYLAQDKLLQGLPIRMLTAGDDTPAAQDQLGQYSAVLRRAGFDVATRILPGEPEDVIAKDVQDEQADLLVMGAFNHSRLRNLFIGSTTTEMIRSCKIPILLFR